ncbi:MAG TPA: NAD+ synthase [Egibacteraceae bacterium]|nr:NAD+ synthase [Egibacteraceae bacterium]
MKLALAQLNPLVGDVGGNAEAIRHAYDDAVAAGADVVVTGELSLTGYPPEDLVLKPAFVSAVDATLGELAAATGRVPLLVGFTEHLDEAVDGWTQPVISEAPSVQRLANAAAVLREGRVERVYRKHRIPNYGVFDEARYFRAGQELAGFGAGTRPFQAQVYVTICEDLWGEGGPVTGSARAGADVVVSMNASPYQRDKRAERERWAAHHAREGGVWIAYANQVGGQDEVIFDGDSFVMRPDGQVVARAARFATDLLLVDVPVDGGGLPPPLAQEAADPVRDVYDALVLATRDYVAKNGFDRVYVGLSGGVDSSLTAAIAADALGPDALTGAAMPSPYSSEHSLADARELAANLGCRYLELPIDKVMAAFDDALAEPFAGTQPGLAEENVQARIRGTLLMALSNKLGGLVLATGNKSELAVGYATLYGDMAGGFAVLKDVWKTGVYELCRHRNARSRVIPESVLTKEPSAELRHDQRDTDSLPPYDVLDPILQAYVEQDASVADIAARGFDEAVVREVTRRVDAAEYKRRQSAPGAKITGRAFGKDRRLPITQGWGG